MINRRLQLPARRVTRPVSVPFEIQHHIADNREKEGVVPLDKSGHIGPLYSRTAQRVSGDSLDKVFSGA
jgi:hypothetical protein